MNKRSRCGVVILVFAAGAVAGLALTSQQSSAQRGGAVEDRAKSTGTNFDLASRLSNVQARVAELEKKLAVLQAQHAASRRSEALHTHEYIAPQCHAAYNLPTLKRALDSGSADGANLTVCLIRASVRGAPKARTSPPVK